MAALQAADFIAGGLGAPGQEVEEAVHHMAVPPGYGPGDAAEDDLVGDELVDFIEVEAVVGGVPEAVETAGQGVGYGLTVAGIDPGGQQDGCYGDDDAGQRHAGVEVDIVQLAVGGNPVAEGQEAGYQGDSCQEHQREGHGQRTFMRGVGGMQGAVFGAPEDAVVEAEHIVGGHAGDEGHHPAYHRTELEAGGEDFVFGEESGERGDAGDGQTGYEEGDVGHGHVFAQASHGAHLVAVYGVDDAAGSQEEEGFKQGMGEEVEQTGHIAQPALMGIGGGADAQGYHHESDLGDGGEGEHALDVALYAGHTGGVEGGKGSGIGHEVQHVGGVGYEQGEHPGHQVDTGYHHGGSVDQGADGSRAFHGIGQPDVQGEQGALAGTADEHQSQGPGDEGAAFHQGHLIGRKGIGTGVVTVDQDSDEEAQVGKTGHDEGFFGSRNGCRTGVVEADEEVGRYAYQLPEEVHLEDVGSYYQTEHGHGEEREECVVTLESDFAFHVAQGVDVYHQGYGADDYQHHHGDGVEQDAEVDAQGVCKGQPAEAVGHQGGVGAVGQTRGSEVGGRCIIRQEGHGAQYAGAEKTRCAVAHPFTSQPQDEEGEHGEQYDE